MLDHFLLSLVTTYEALLGAYNIILIDHMFNEVIGPVFFIDVPMDLNNRRQHIYILGQQFDRFSFVFG